MLPKKIRSIYKGTHVSPYIFHYGQVKNNILIVPPPPLYTIFSCCCLPTYDCTSAVRSIAHPLYIVKSIHLFSYKYNMINVLIHK